MSLTNRFYDLGRKALLTAVLATSALPSYSEAARPRRRAYLKQPQNYSQTIEPKAQLEQKVQGELIDNQLSWIDQNSQAQFKQLYGEYKQVLIKKQKFDPKKEKILIYDLLSPNWREPKSTVEVVKKYLLREQDPEQYLKTYIKDSEEIKKIKTISLRSVSEKEKQGLRNIFEQGWKMNSDTPDISDQIFMYEIQKTLKTPIQVPPTNFQPISGNPLVR